LYNKEEIDKLFKLYVKDKADEVLWELIEACSPIIRIRLARYNGTHDSCRLDAEQEVKIKLFKNLRDPRRKGSKDLSYQLQSPTSYLYFLIRRYVRSSMNFFDRMYGREISISNKDGQIINMIQDETVNPEVLYIVKTVIPNDFYNDCKREIEEDKSLQNFPIIRQTKIRKIRHMIEESFGVALND